MDVKWDPAKAKANFQKHGVHFSDAEVVLFDPLALTMEDEDAESEDRYISSDMMPWSAYSLLSFHIAKTLFV